MDGIRSLLVFTIAVRSSELAGTLRIDLRAVLDERQEMLMRAAHQHCQVSVRSIARVEQVVEQTWAQETDSERASRYVRDPSCLCGT